MSTTSLIRHSNKIMIADVVNKSESKTELCLPNGNRTDINEIIFKDGVISMSPWTKLNAYTESETLPKVYTPNKLRCDKNESQKHRKKCVYLFLVFFLFTMVVTFCTLYAFEVRKSRFFEKNTGKTPPLPSEPCFRRAYAKRINDIESHSEFLEAVVESKTGIAPELFYGKYKAVSITVTYYGEEIWKFNYANSTDINTPTTQTPFPIASVSKVFTVLMLHKLVEQNFIKSIDDPIHLYTSAFTINNNFNNESITFRHLACMMAGIQREAPCYPYTNISYCPFNNTVMLKRIQKLSLLFPPKQSPSYSNLAASILGRILERIVANTSLEAWIDANILKPLSMNNTGYDILSRKADIPKSYNEDGSLAQISDWGWSRPSGGMFSTTHDLGKLSSIFFSASDVFNLSERSLNELFQPAFIWPDSNAQGCPFEIASFDPYNEENKRVAYMNFAKDGSILGYGTLFNLIPDLKLNVNVMVASPQGQASFISKIIVKNFSKAIDQILNKMAKKYILPPDYKYYVGTYKLETYWPLIQRPARVYIENNVLILNIEWFITRLSYVNNRTLETMNYEKEPINHGCEMLGLGLLYEKYNFFPLNGRNESDGFTTDAIGIYGYAKFRRIS